MPFVYSKGKIVRKIYGTKQAEESWRIIIITIIIIMR
jgi:hypothetical protein